MNIISLITITTLRIGIFIIAIETELGSIYIVITESNTGIRVTGVKYVLASFKELNKYEKIADLGLESKEGKKVTSVTIDCQNDQPMITVTTVGGTFDPITSK